MDMFDVVQEETKSESGYITYLSEARITLYGKEIGKFKEERVQSLLKKAGRDTWTKKLRDFIDDVYIDYDVCPHCAGTNFRRHREIVPHVIAGFCADCKAELVSVCGRLEDLRSGKCGVLQSHSRLYYTIEEEAI